MNFKLNKKATFSRKKVSYFPQFALRKKAVIGSLTTTFVAIIIIAILLIVFIVGSYFFKEISGVDKGEKIDDKYTELINIYSDDQKNYIDFKYNSYFSSIKQAEFLLNCKGIFNGKEMNFKRVLYLWDNSNTEDIFDFIEKNKCATGFFYAEKNSESFYCGNGQCKHYPIKEEDFIEDSQGRNIILKFENVNLKISNLDLEVENVAN